MEMVTLVQSSDSWGPRQLAGHFGISQRRIYQDIRELGAAGVPIVYTGAGYSVEQAFLPALNLTPEETLLLLSAVQCVREKSRKAIHERVEAKLLSCLAPPVRRLAKQSLERIDVPFTTPLEHNEAFELIHGAVAERRRVVIEYRSVSADDYRERTIDPLGLSFRRSWYVVAFCHRRREVRTFKLNRVRSCRLTGESFEPPAGFSVKEYLAGRWGIFGGEEREVVIRFGPIAARLIEDGPPPKNGALMQLSDGSAIFRGKVKGLQELGWWLMKYGEQAEVIRPAELREQVIETIRRMAALYKLARPEMIAAEEEAEYGAHKPGD